MSFTLEVSKTGRDVIIFNKHKYRQCYKVKNGDIVFRCLGRTCKAFVKTNTEKTGIFDINESHSGPHPITMRALTPTQHTPGRYRESPNVRAVLEHSILTPSSAQATNDMTTPSQGNGLKTSSPTLELARQPQQGEPSTLRVDAENAKLKEQLAILTERLNCVLDHTVESDTRLLQYTNEIFPVNTSHCTPCGEAPVVDCAVQCELDCTKNSQCEMSILRKENENLKTELRKCSSDLHVKELENASLKNKTQELENELNMVKSSANCIQQDFKKTYPNDSFTCLTKRMETEIYCKNVRIKELTKQNSELRNEINTLNTIIEILLNESQEDGSHLIKQAMFQQALEKSRNSDSDEFQFAKKTANEKHMRSRNAPNFETPNRFKELITDESPNIPGSIVEVEAEIHKTYPTPRYNNYGSVVGSLNHCSKGKITVLTDSQGRGLANEMNKHIIGFNSMVFTKPGAKLKHVVGGCKRWVQGFSPQDYLIIFGGTNDLGFHEPHNLTIPQGLRELFSLNKDTNVIIIDLPYRHDLPDLNNNIFFTNQKIKNMVQQHNGKTNFLHLQVNNYLKRKHYTRHGLHLNRHGKALIVKKLSDIINHNSRYASPTYVYPCNTQTTRENHPHVKQTYKIQRKQRQLNPSPDIVRLSSTSCNSFEETEDEQTAATSQLQGVLRSFPDTPASLHFQLPTTTPASISTTSPHGTMGESPPNEVDSISEASLTLDDLQAFPPLPQPSPSRQNVSKDNLDLDFLSHVQELKLSPR